MLADFRIHSRADLQNGNHIFQADFPVPVGIALLYIVSGIGSVPIFILIAVSVKIIIFCSGPGE